LRFAVIVTYEIKSLKEGALTNNCAGIGMVTINQYPFLRQQLLQVNLRQNTNYESYIDFTKH
jgi:hypothetical protein